ncbi:laccase-1 [Microdochium trichocladiopsis]|uniref:Laccase-1 n=1 Tax=Microdochium trichocladiopsis TaxID=1682393 RepID=A0A9P8XU02_9PEZI|nr:laccase-1 [Microdochium trichocladiopsis]KAH7018082.1 laccase-1 [Microdochium trichocladiopsis]
MASHVRHALAFQVTCTSANPFTSFLTPRAACDGNTASSRSEWCDLSIDTDYTKTVPDTGVTRTYYFDLAEVTVAPDGVERFAMAINGSIPGPAIVADWGDTVVVHLTNSLSTSTNGTSLHFHGIWQRNTNQNDGVASITQCPTPPGSSITYTWRALQYGSTWYHSHFALQAWQGVFGPIVINGPATANYDEDLGHVFLNDWDHSTVDELYHQAESQGPPVLDNGLINGMNVFGEDGDESQTGQRFSVSVAEGSSYRLRLVNGAVDTHFRFSIDNHTMQVIAMDLVPIVPYVTDGISIGMGQRYDIIITANQSSVASDFWIRAIPQSACSENAAEDNIRGILHYGDSTGTPTTTGFAYVDACADEDTTDLVPYLPATVGDDATWNLGEGVSVGLNAENLFRWYLNSTTMLVSWDNPTLERIAIDGEAASDFAADDAHSEGDGVIMLDDADAWIYLVISTTMSVPHPIHLHGHDFFILAQGSGTYSSSTVALNMANPPRRDTAMLPASGHLVLAFQTDNPGAWLMHCHIGWHTSEGFALQFIERYSEISALLDKDSLQGNCDAWGNHAATSRVVQDDSGV